ncbi:hypothetical protein [Microlunatus soli]|nr:hypothetical protein [Microlunatus soli]
MAARPGTVGIVIGAVLTVVGGVPCLLCAGLAVSARFGPASSDPHGYTMIFGTLFAVICAVPMLAGLAILLPSIHRRRSSYPGQHDVGQHNDRVQP